MPMTQIWLAEKKIATTPVFISPCVVSQIKSLNKDNYFSLQIATGNRKEKNINKAQLGHYSKAKVKPAFVKELRLKKESSAKVGQEIDLMSFSENETINVTGISKGKGFQGVVKRHGFAGGDKSHGNKDQLRMPGSIGAMGPARVFKGIRMGGRMGGEQTTIKNLKIIKIDSDKNILYIQGAVPGSVNSWLVVKAPGELKFKEEKKEEEKIEKKEEAKKDA